ncbi:MAG: hypothetical protein GC154_15010 [bacterium]|nr:hypothetical protein [bacterium]
MCAEGKERRVFEREEIRIPFIYSLDEGESLTQGEWKEAITLDIGPVLIGGLAFFSEKPYEIGQKMRLSLFMDLDLKNTLHDNPEEQPPIYHGAVCRIEPYENGHKVAVVFKGMEDIILQFET